MSQLMETGCRRLAPPTAGSRAVRALRIGDAPQKRTFIPELAVAYLAPIRLVHKLRNPQHPKFPASSTRMENNKKKSCIDAIKT
jgi:hypothetical protein